MKNHTVVQLKVIAKERVIRGYYQLRKAELIHALEATKLVEQQCNIFDEPIKTKNVFTMGMQKIKDFGEWLLNYISPKPKVVDKVLESFKNKIKKKL